MSSFDQSLKHLLHSRPEDFIRFGMADPTIEVLEPAEAALPARPARNRDVDGGYRFRCGAQIFVGHVEFHRRHQSRRDLALDVAEAQIRFHRREGLRVVSFVWDLYGQSDEPLLARRRHRYGAADGKKPVSQVAYRRVNLRALGYEELLSSAPPTLWPLVALTHDGATEPGVKAARDAIVARKDLRKSERADHLAVLRFVGEKENVAIAVLMAYISKEDLMASTLYKTIFKDGKVAGEAKAYADMLVFHLGRRLGVLDPAVRERIRKVPDVAILKAWYNEVVDADADRVRRLVDRIRNASLVEAAAP